LTTDLENAPPADMQARRRRRLALVVGAFALAGLACGAYRAVTTRYDRRRLRKRQRRADRAADLGTAVSIAVSAWLVLALVAVAWLARPLRGAAEANDAAAGAH
jgi:hypothetical protein